MQKEKQARRKNIGAAVNNQTQKPADEGGEKNASWMAGFNKALSDVSREIDDTIREAESTREEIRLLCLRYYIENLEYIGLKEEGETSAGPVPSAPPPQQTPPDSELRKRDSLYLNFSNMDSAVNSAMGMLDLMACRLVELIEESHADGGGIAAGITSQAWDVGRFLRSRFDELFDEAKRQRGWGVKGSDAL